MRESDCKKCFHCDETDGVEEYWCDINENYCLLIDTCPIGVENSEVE